MKENSIEETIKIIERKIKEAEHYSNITGLCLTLDEELRNALMNILSDYKRVLKENEILKEEKEQAWEEWNILEQGSYETEQKLKQQIKKLQKENEGLKILKSGIQTLQNLGIEDGKYIVMSKTDFLNGSCKHLLDDYIPVQKVKEKMEKDIKTNEHTILGGRRNGKTLEYGKRLGRIEMCQELLEGENKICMVY